MRFVSSAAIALLASTLGCSSSTEGAASGTSTSQSTAAADSGSFCDAYCGRIGECDRKEDLQTCKADCENELGGSFDKLRADVMSEVSGCFSGADCREVLSGQHLAFCIDLAAVNATPTAAGRSLCDELAAAHAKCDRVLDVPACLKSTKLFTDSALEDAKACTAKSCSAIGPCVDAVLAL